MMFCARSGHGAKPRRTSSSRHRLAGDRLGRVVVVGDDEVEHLPARQRVVDEWHFGPAQSVAAFQRKSSGICSVGITER